MDPPSPCGESPTAPRLNNAKTTHPETSKQHYNRQQQSLTCENSPDACLQLNSAGNPMDPSSFSMRGGVHDASG